MTPCICSDSLWWHHGRKDELSPAIRQKQMSELVHIRVGYLGQFILVSLTEHLGSVFLTQLWCYTGCKKLGYKYSFYLFVESCTLDTEVNQITTSLGGWLPKSHFVWYHRRGREQEQRKGRSNMHSVNRYKVKCHMTHQKGTPELGIFSHHISFKNF